MKAALAGKQDLSDEETARLKQLWKKLVLMDGERDASLTDCGETPQPRP